MVSGCICSASCVLADEDMLRSVCETDKACENLVNRDSLSTGLIGGQNQNDDGAVCYKEGFGIKEMFQMCDVTSRFLRLNS